MEFHIDGRRVCNLEPNKFLFNQFRKIIIVSVAQKEDLLGHTSSGNARKYNEREQNKVEGKVAFMTLTPF